MSRPERDRRAVGWLSLWAGILVPPATWAVQLSVSYLLVTIDCLTGLPRIDLWLISLGVVVLAVDIGSAIVAYRAWRRTGVGTQTEIGGPAGRSGYMAITGILLSIVFAFTMILTTISPLVLESCSAYEVLH